MAEPTEAEKAELERLRRKLEAEGKIKPDTGAGRHREDPSRRR